MGSSRRYRQMDKDKESITIYGDGKQVRDMLYADDLLDGYDAAISHIKQAGQVYSRL